MVPPSRKVTVPVAAEGEVVAVKVTLERTPIGVFRDAPRATYDQQFRDQLAQAQEQRRTDLATMLGGSDTWEIA